MPILVLKHEIPNFRLEYYQNPGSPWAETYFKNHFRSQITFLMLWHVCQIAPTQNQRSYFTARAVGRGRWSVRRFSPTNVTFLLADAGQNAEVVHFVPLSPPIPSSLPPSLRCENPRNKQWEWSQLYGQACPLVSVLRVSNTGDNWRVKRFQFT